MKLTEKERAEVIPVENVRYEQAKSIWVREKRDIFLLSQMLNKPVLLVENGKHEYMGIKSEKIYSVLFVLDNERTYMYALKEKGGSNRKAEEKGQEKD